MAKKTYTENGVTFTDAQINLIVQMTREASRGYLRPNPPVRRALARRENLSVWIWAQTVHLVMLGQHDGRRAFVYVPFEPDQYSIRFNVKYDLPREALWRLVRPMLRTDGPSGYSVTRHDGWLDLNICPRGSTTFKRDEQAEAHDLEEMRQVFARLAGDYLWFQQASDIWEITPNKEYRTW